MDAGQHEPVLTRYKYLLDTNRLERDALTAEMHAELSELELQCLQEHGTHQDSGHALDWLCVRCGAYIRRDGERL